MCKVLEVGCAGRVQGEVRSHKVLKAVLGSLAFTPGATGSHRGVLSRGGAWSDVSMKFTLTTEWIAGRAGQGREAASRWGRYMAQHCSACPWLWFRWARASLQVSTNLGFARAWPVVDAP